MNKSNELKEQPRKEVKCKKQRHSKKYVKEIKKKLQVSMFSIAMILLLIAGSKLAGLHVPLNNIKDIGKEKLTADESKTQEETIRKRETTKVTIAEDGAIVCDSIVQGVRDSELKNGTYTFRVTGNINGTNETKDYKVELINYYGDVTYALNAGETSKTVSLGDNTTEYKMLVVKYHKNLTINKGVTITATNVSNLTYKKGMYLCVMGELKNNGTISMTARGTYNQVGENVYLWRNSNNTYEYVPSVGAAGVNSNTVGQNGKGRQTGGGSGGVVETVSGGTGGAGAAGTSYSGGTGGGGSTRTYAGNGSANGANGGTGGSYYNNYPHGGGAGNPGGYGNTGGQAGENGTGGLLIIYANNFINNNQIVSNGSKGGDAYASGGSSGGGSINIFYNILTKNGEILASGGRAANRVPTNGYQGQDGHVGGNGTITMMQVKPKLEYPIKAKLNINQTYIKAGEKIQLTVLSGTDETSNPDGVGEHPSINDLNNNEFTWTSTNKDIAEVDGNGLVTGLKDGYTSIYATYKYTDEEGNEKTILAECIINVNQEKATPQIETGNGFTVVLKADGTVWKVGNQDINTDNIEGRSEGTPTQIKINETENLENVVKIAVGTNEILALTENGEIYTYNISDEYAIKNETLTNIVDISAGNNIYIALDASGNVYTWNNETEPKKQEIENIIRISAGNGNVTALESNGLLWTWGENGKGQLGLNSKINIEYPVAVETEVTETSSGGTHAIIQKTDRKIYGTGDMYQTAVYEEIAVPNVGGDPMSDHNVKYFKTGYNTTTIMLQNGSIYGEGGNTRGELGIGTNENAGQFTQGLTLDTSNNSVTNGNPDNVGTHRVHPLEDALIIGDSSGNGETSSLNTAVILENGNIYVTGDNTNGQIGDGTTESKNHYTKMGYAELDYEEKEIILDETGYQIDINKLKYNETTLNVYDNNTPIEIGKLEYTSSDEEIATVNENGFITAHKTFGTAKITIKDVTNGYETKITIIVKNIRLQDTDTVTYIYNIEDLVKFRDSVNAGNGYAGKTVYVMEDIDMSTHCSEALGVSWEPIGATGTNFAGTFDGNYHTLSNLYYNSNVNDYVGLFAQNNGIIQNLILDNVYVFNTNAYENVYSGRISWL